MSQSFQSRLTKTTGVISRSILYDRLVMAEGSVNGYTLDEEGSIVRTGIAEDSEQQTSSEDRVQKV